MFLVSLLTRFILILILKKLTNGNESKSNLLTSLKIEQLDFF